MTDSHLQLRRLNPSALRQTIRSGRYTSHTAGLGEGYLQANLAIMPERWALDFMRYCQRNPKLCPVSGVSDTGNPMMQTLGREIDIRSDVPAYNIYRRQAGRRLGARAFHIADACQGALAADQPF